MHTSSACALVVGGACRSAADSSAVLRTLWLLPHHSLHSRRCGQWAGGAYTNQHTSGGCSLLSSRSTVRCSRVLTSAWACAVGADRLVARRWEQYQCCLALARRRAACGFISLLHRVAPKMRAAVPQRAPQRRRATNFSWVSRPQASLVRILTRARSCFAAFGVWSDLNNSGFRSRLETAGRAGERSDKRGARRPRRLSCGWPCVCQQEDTLRNSSRPPESRSCSWQWLPWLGPCIWSTFRSLSRQRSTS